MHYLHDKEHRHSYVPGYEPDWLAGIVVNHGLNLTNKLDRPYQNDPYCWRIAVPS